MELQLEQIIQNTGVLFRQYGIRSVTMDDVSRHLGISKKTLYLYVKDKKELVALFLKREQDNTSTAIHTVFSKGLNAIEELFELNRIMLEYFASASPSFLYDLKKYYPSMLCELKERKRERMYQYIKTNIEKGQSGGLYRTNMDADVITRLHMARLEGNARPEIFSDEECRSEHVLSEIFIYHIRGMASKKGIALLEQKLEEYDYYQSK